MLLLRLLFFLLRYAFYLLRITLFRLYLLLFFCTHPAAPLLSILLPAAALFLGWSIAGPLLAAGADWLLRPLAGWAARQPRGDGMRDLVELLWPARLGLLLALVALGQYWLMGWLQWTLAFLLPAFPFPRRPLPPVWRRRPPEHRIETVRCRLAVPRLRQRWWPGEPAELIHFLKPELQALLQVPPRAIPAPPPEPIGSQELISAPQSSAVTGQGGGVPVEAEEAPKGNSGASAPRAHRSRPAPPPVPPSRHAAE